MLYLPPTNQLERQAIDRAHGRADDGGVWTRSAADRAYVIFCVGQKDSQIRRFLRHALKTNLGFKPLRGCYKGKEERSFIVNVADLKKVTPFIHGQESIMLIHSYNRADVPKATLIEVATGRRTELGLFVMGDERVKQDFENWTFDPVNHCYFVTQGAR